MIFKYTNQDIGFLTKNGERYVKITEDSHRIVLTGDYVIQNNGDMKIISAVEYAANLQLRRLVVQEVAIQLLEDMIQALQDLSVTDAVKLDLLKTVDVVLIMVVGNKITAGRVICNAIATTANFTTARKNALLALMDAAILLL